MSRYAIAVDNFLHMEEALSIEAANRMENVWFFRRNPYDDFNYMILIGVSIETHQFATKEELEYHTSLFHSENYILSYNPQRRPMVMISLSDKSDQESIFKAVFNALVLYLARRSLETDSKDFANVISIYNSTSDPMDLLKITYIYTEEKFDDFLTKLKNQQWDLSKNLFQIDDWRYEL